MQIVFRPFRFFEAVRKPGCYTPANDLHLQRQLGEVEKQAVVDPERSQVRPHDCEVHSLELLDGFELDYDLVANEKNDPLDCDFDVIAVSRMSAMKL